MTAQAVHLTATHKMVTSLHLMQRTPKHLPVLRAKRTSRALVKVIAVLAVTNNVLP
jgi:hypothetical protein